MTAQARVSWYTFYSLNFRLTLARLESGPMFCLLLMPITIESFRVVVKELQFLLVSAAISLATYLLNATMARCQKEFVKDERRAREAGWDDVRFVAMFMLYLASSLCLSALALSTFAYALGLGYCSWLLMPAAAALVALGSRRATFKKPQGVRSVGALWSGTLVVVHGAYEVMFPDRGRDRATQRRDFLVSTGASVVVYVLALQEWMPHPHRDATFIENASLLMAAGVTSKLLAFLLLHTFSELLSSPPP